VVLLSQKTILVVDDQKEICELVRDYLELEGYHVTVAYDGESAIECYRNQKPDLIILDVMLPIIDGMEVCRTIRNESTVPILMLSARKSDVDKILGLGLGADDYITKPFSPGELMARVRAQIRRSTLFSSPIGKTLLEFGNLKIDSKGYNVYIGVEKIDLSAKEFEILHFLALHPEQVFTREQIFNQIWGFNEYGDINTVTVHIRKIREKIESDPSHPQYISTVWGVGYKMKLESDRSTYETRN
jgi:DNA-binding response OmpR family regulator